MENKGDYQICMNAAHKQDSNCFTLFCAPSRQIKKIFHPFPCPLCVRNSDIYWSQFLRRNCSQKIRYFHPLTQPSTTKQRCFFTYLSGRWSQNSNIFTIFTYPAFAALQFQSHSRSPSLKTCVCAHPSNISSFISASTEKDEKFLPSLM